MNFKYILGSILAIPFLPAMYFQVKSIKSNIPDLPEAKNPEGHSTNGQVSSKSIRMLAIGESTIAGVGVQTHSEGFTGTLADSLCRQLHADVYWKVYAQSGFTAKRVAQEIIPKISENEIDLLIVGIGGNDAFTLNTPGRWKKDVKELIKNLRRKFPNAPIVFCSMPPIKEFPAFTPLIKATVGNLVEILGEELQGIIKTYEKVFYQQTVLTIDNWNKKFDLDCAVTDFFSDGVHPSPLAYQTWAKDMAEMIITQNILPKRSADIPLSY